MIYTGTIPDSFDLYIFDLDGTLVDSLTDLAFAVNEILLQYGFSALSLEDVRSGVGTGARNLLLRTFALSVELDSDALNTLVDKALPHYLEYYETHSMRTTSLYPGIKNWLLELSTHNKKMAVLTNKSDDATKKIVRALGAEQFFNIIAGPDYAGVLKPDGGGILRILKETGVSPSRAIMIGDSMVDFHAGRNAGVAVCGISGGLGDEDALRHAGCDFFIERLSPSTGL